MIDQFTPIIKQRGSYLFHEGEPANYIYIVINGEFKIMKKVHRQKFAFEENTDAILKDPLKAKRQNSEFDIKNSKTSADTYILESAYRNQFLGIEDVVNCNAKYSVSVCCESKGKVV